MGSDQSKRTAATIGAGVVSAVLGKTITGVVTSIISTVTNSDNLTKEIARQKDIDEIKRINKNTAIKYFSTTAKRDIALPKESAYSTESIRESLSKGRIPPSYSLALLADSGFSTEVDKFIIDAETRRKNANSKSSFEIKRLIEKVRTALKEDSDISFELESLGITEELLLELDDIAEDFASDKITPAALKFINGLFTEISTSLTKAHTLTRQADIGAEAISKAKDNFQSRLLALNRAAILREAGDAAKVGGLSPGGVGTEPKELEVAFGAITPQAQERDDRFITTVTRANLGF